MELRHLIEALRGGGTSVYKNGKLIKQTYGPDKKKEDEVKKPRNSLGGGGSLTANRIRQAEKEALGENDGSY